MNIDAKQNWLRISLTTMLLLLALPWPAVAVEKTSQSMPVVDQQVLKSKIKEVEATTSLDDATKNKLTEYYRRSLTNLEKVSSFEADAENFSQARKTAPAEIESLRIKLKKKPDTPDKSLRISDKTPLKELEQLLQKEKADLAAAEARLSDFNKRLEIQTTRPTSARERLVAAKREQETVIAERKAAVPAGEQTSITQARNWQLESQARALSAEIKMLDQELLSHQVRKQLLEAKRDNTEQDLRIVAAGVRLIEGFLNKRRLSEVEQAQQEAEAIKKEFMGMPLLVRELAEENVALGEELKLRALELERVAAEDDDVRASAKRIGSELSTVRQKLEVAGLSQVLGRVLIEQRRALPDLANMQRQAGQREQLIASAGLQLIQYGEERRRLRDIDAYITELGQDLSAAEFDSIRPELRELTLNRLELLDKAMSSESSYLRTLGELDLAQRQLIDVVTAFDEYLGKRLLWIRSTEAISLSRFRSLPQELGQLLSPVNWFTTAKDLLQQLLARPLHIILMLVLTVLVFMRRRFLDNIIASGKKIGRIRSDKLSYTLQALGWTVLASVALPLLLLAIGWQLSIAAEAVEFSKAVAEGLIRLAAVYLFLQFFTDVAISDGLVAKHFRWPVSSVTKLRSELRLLMLVLLPVLFINALSTQLDRAGLNTSLSLLAVLLAIGSIGAFVYRVFTPNGGVLAEFFAKDPRNLLARLRPVWLGFLIVVVIGLIVLALSGYLYTSLTLTRNLIGTLLLIYFLVVVRGLVVRWLLLVSRRLALQAAIERREAERAAREAEQQAEESDVIGADETMEIEEPEVDLAALDADSRKLLNIAILFTGVIGLWLIWSPELPAFGILDYISLWQQTKIIDGVETLVPVTLADLALALIVAIVTVSAARGLPAFLEFMLLQRISISAGGRYTAITLLRYTIFGVGTVIFFSILGGSWSQIQWLVAALGVGIGFGLQEIVANFISGLIILFERPIRVGDTVTVGDTTGVVTRIKIRATTITNWDRQELLVPNKEFITTRLLNWSLSDPIIRIVIPVGIAYGSDVAKAMKLMKESACEHKYVLEDPAPSVTFESFGDNALQLYLRSYIPTIDNRVGIITDLHKAIDHKFNEAGIVIAFPQRDVHIDASTPIDVRIRPDQDHEKPA